MRTLFLLLLAAGTVHASDYARLREAAYTEPNPENRVSLFARTISAFAEGDDKRSLGITYNDLGNLLTSQGRNTDALIAFDSAVGLLPEEAEVRSNKAMSLMMLRRFPGALAEATIAFNQKPDSSAILANICAAFLGLDEPEHALPFCEKSFRIMPNNIPVNQSLTLTYALLGRYDEAARSLELMRRGDNRQYMDQSLADPSAQILEGALESLNGHAAQGEALLAKAVSENPKLTLALVARGRVRLRRGLYDQAIEDFDRAYAQDPNFVDAIAFRAKADEKAGRPAMAAKDRAKACRLGWTPDCKKKRT